MSKLRRRLAGPILAAGLLLGATATTAGAQIDRMVDDFDVQCVYYTETSGSCVSTTRYSDGSIEHKWYVFWGNWYAQV